MIVEVVDPYEPGAGRIWRSEQSGALLMNTVIGQITIFGHDPEDPEEDAGPSFIEWLEALARPEHQELSTNRNGYSPRRVYGQYLADAFKQTVKRAPEWLDVQLDPRRGHERRRRHRGGSGYQVTLTEGGARHADVVVLTTGHPRNTLRPHEVELDDFAKRHEGLRYVPGDSAADMPLDEVTKDDVVAIRGLGPDVLRRLRTPDNGSRRQVRPRRRRARSSTSRAARSRRSSRDHAAACRSRPAASTRRSSATPTSRSARRSQKIDELRERAQVRAPGRPPGLQGRGAAAADARGAPQLQRPTSSASARARRRRTSS